ncbi:hypothetical protein K432DRAFT_303017 [Lepidopterella palustris CBS 459.81]|uniref:EDC4-like protein pdc1 beta-propeller domain-containing protein n=1 Tax=Lepidopterella palustris CBS 459.81 TaxID=1314670 RepID=A0A8E2E5X4_9PEZI|nr:hypothetical protein K432DRAFT_303017 [Lepidopterella palustris CBS 459.81]
MADLQELFARLNSQSVTSPGASGKHSIYRQPSVSSPILSPTPMGPQPHHSSAVISPNTSSTNTPAPEQNSSSDRTANLLNLLRFNQPSGVPQKSLSDRRPSHHQNLQTAETSGVHARTISANDLVATFMQTPTTQGSTFTPMAVPPASKAKAEQATSSPENTQDLLLRLLNHPKAPKSDRSNEVVASIETPTMPETAVDDLTQDLADAKLEKVPSDPSAKGRTASPIRVFGSDSADQTTSFEPPKSAPKSSIFTYVNPFEQLSASTPRTRTPVPDRQKTTTPKVEILKPKHGRDTSSGVSGDNKDQGPESSGPALKTRKLSPGSVRSPVASPAATPVKDHPHETVSEAVGGIREQVDKQVEEALAQADKQANGHLNPKAEDVPMTKDDVKELETAIHDTTVEVQKELEDESNSRVLDEMLSKPNVEALKEVVDEVAHADVADSWESAEAEAEDTPVAKDEDQPGPIRVYKFPMRAFASITVKKLPENPPALRKGAILDIARLKKDFDQIDRSLVAATKEFIVYALAKHGGFRIIRQETGQFRQVFQNFKERIFNLTICTAVDPLVPAESPESILGIGINGTVFWTSATGEGADQIGSLENAGLIFPPSPAQDDNTSGGQLKTRAKTSSRHPDYFAVGRGKSIHIIWPKVARQERYTDSQTRVCNTEKYLKERSLKILTGKAGKDFAFSEDDTVIVSLDKAGRMRFWDIRELTVEDYGVSTNNEITPVEVYKTLLEFTTTSPTAKSWPTSVFFFDKDRPCAKGIALRYVMVGMKQNHTFQLWDLGLGKAVQEIHLPHEKESDAICSVAFNPKTGILAVGHPTRNSIYFIHVSCPRYNLPPLSQAAFITRLASKEVVKGAQALPPVNATAIMTSVHEYSFASKGQLRSLHMLNDPANSAENDDPGNTPFFELYVMHSKGVSCLQVGRVDLGWKKDGEALHPVEAEATGVITVSAMKPPQGPTSDDASAGGETSAPKSGSDRSTRESVKKESSNASRQSLTPEAAMRASTLAKVESKQDAARAAIINGAEKAEKKKKKRSTADAVSQTSNTTRTNPAVVTPASYAQAAQRAASPSPQPAPAATPAAKPAVSSKLPEMEAPEWATRLLSQHLPQAAVLATPAGNQDLRKLEENISVQFSKGFSRELESLYNRIEEDKRVQAAANAAKQDAILRLVSSTLTENVQSNLTAIVSNNFADFQQTVLPQLGSNVSSVLERVLERKLGDVVKEAFQGVATKEIKSEINEVLPGAVQKGIQDAQIIRGVSERVIQVINGQIEDTISNALALAMAPTFATFTASIEHRVANQIEQARIQHQHDAVKIEQLSNLVRGLSETVQSMAGSQAEFQAQILRLQVESSRSPRATSFKAESTSRAASSPIKTPEDVEKENILSLMSQGNYEAGTMTWLQSGRTAEIFDDIFVRCDPAYLAHVSPLVALSTAAVVTEPLHKNVLERLVWLDCVLNYIDPLDPEIRDVVPRIMEILGQRLTSTYIHLNETAPGTPALRKISSLVSRVNEFSRASHNTPFRRVT